MPDRRRLARSVAVFAALLLTLHIESQRSLLALPPSPDDIFEARRWAAARFEGASIQPEVDTGLVVEANHGHVQKDLRGERPLRIAGATFFRGLYCHAPSRIAVRLPGPGKELQASVGVDSNEQTRPGRGSVVFIVRAGGKNPGEKDPGDKDVGGKDPGAGAEGREVFRSGLMREGMKAAPVRADLAGATELTLEVTDGGDGISCDQADWADLSVVLADGKALSLSGLPMVQRHLPPCPTEPPFAFTYGGKPSSALLEKWEPRRERRTLEDGRVERTLTWTDPATCLAAGCVALEHPDYPVVEWTLHFRNGGAADTPVISDLKSLSLRFDRGVESEFVLHHHRGDTCAPNSFEPFATELAAGAEKSFAPAGGRPSSGAWPYFNLHWGGEGVILAIGWPGQWAARFSRDAGTSLEITAGQELTRFVLHPGEEVRSPLSLLLFYRGEWIRGQNVWRRWMLDRVFPKPDGKPLSPKLAGCSGWHFPGLMCNQAGEIEFIDRYFEEGIRLDYWWMDAGWYPCDGVGWPKVGTWEVDRKRYPGGLRAVTDHAHAKGVQGIVWFEPERVHPGTWLAESHPEWIHGGRSGGLLDLGNREARQWLTDHVDGILKEQGIDLYRQDFNIDPLTFWRAADPPDRQGMTEIRHVEGYLAYWDELRRRHPGMLIDSCASGGRRNDIESMRRAVPLLRTDCEFHATGNQCHTYGFDLWLPFHEIGNRDLDPYSFRSNMGPMMGFVWDVRRKDIDYDLARRLIGQWREVADCYFGDFYPLTRYSAEEDAWMAWQLDLPGRDRVVPSGAEGRPADQGIVQAFRRSESIYESGRLVLRGLDPDGRYAVRSLDAEEASVMAGHELLERGLLVSIPDRPGAAVVKYVRVDSGSTAAASQPGAPDRVR